MHNPELMVIGGANGSGKTTFALKYAGETDHEYLSADALASELRADAPEVVSIAAGREFVRRVRRGIELRGSMIIESTLAGKSLRHTFLLARDAGFEVTLVYLFLESADTCVERVQERVAKGGHFVPEQDIRRRFARSLHNFWGLYRPLADSWLLVYNSGVAPVDVAMGTASELSIRDDQVFALFRQMSGD